MAAEHPPAPRDALVAAARAGDRASFDALVAPELERLHRYLTTMTGDPHATEDLVQDSLQRAFEHLDQLQDAARFPSWLLSIACNACRSHLRRQVQRAAGRPDDDATTAERPDPHHSPLSSLVRREDAVRLQLAIDRLPILLREAFVLFAVEGLPYTEIAAAAGAAEGTLQVRVHRARSLLQTQLGPIFDTWLGGR